MKRFSCCVIQVLFLLVTQLAWGQTSSGLAVGENLFLKSSGTVTAGYSGDSGDAISSAHSLNVGVSGAAEGFYYNPNFLSFNVTPYYNQSKADSASQSLSNGSGVAAQMSLFTGSRFPATFSYRADFNTTTSANVIGEPNFTSRGNGQGFGIGWSASLPALPNVSVGYSHGSGTSNVYGTSTESQSTNDNLNVRSSYQMFGFPLSAYYTHSSFHSEFPELLTTQVMQKSDSSGHDYGISTNHRLPIHGTAYFNFGHSVFADTYGSSSSITSTNYSTNMQTAGALFNPTKRLGVSLVENYVSDLSGEVAQSIASSGVVPVVDLGKGAHSLVFSGGVNYELFRNVVASAQATHVSQHFLGNDYSSTYASGTILSSRKLFDMFTVSASVLDSESNQSNNTIGFAANVNYFRRFGGWVTSGTFTYSQNAETMLVLYTQSSYNYSARVTRRLTRRIQWISAFSGSHSGLSTQMGSSHSESYNTSVGSSRYSVTASYSNSAGYSLLTAGGVVVVPPTPGVSNTQLTQYSGTGYNFGGSISPIRNLAIAGSYSHSLSNTLANSISSKNQSEQTYAQVQYHLRRINLMAGYTRLTQGISATGAPPTSVTSYFVGVSRWFNFF